MRSLGANQPIRLGFHRARDRRRRASSPPYALGANGTPPPAGPSTAEAEQSTRSSALTRTRPCQRSHEARQRSSSCAQPTRARSVPMGLAREAARPARRPRCPLCNSASSVWYQAKSGPPRLATRGRKEACDSTNGWAGSACDRVSAGSQQPTWAQVGCADTTYHAARFLHAAALLSSAPDSFRRCDVANCRWQRNVERHAHALRRCKQLHEAVSITSLLLWRRVHARRPTQFLILRVPPLLDPNFGRE